MASHVPSAAPTPAAGTADSRRWPLSRTSAMDKSYYRYSHESTSEGKEKTWKQHLERAERVNDPAARRRDRAFMRKLAKKHPELAAPLRTLYPEMALAAATPSKAEHRHREWRAQGHRHAERAAAQSLANTQTMMGHSTAVQTQMGQTWLGQTAAGQTMVTGMAGMSRVSQAQAAMGDLEKPLEETGKKFTASLLIILLIAVSTAAIVLAVVTVNEDEGEIDVLGHGGKDGGSGENGRGSVPPGPSRPSGPSGPAQTHSPRSPQTYRPAVKYPADYSSFVYNAENNTVVCVYQAQSQYLSQEGYDLPHFPFPYCQLAIYCCLTMTNQYVYEPHGADPGAFYAFRALGEDNPFFDPRVIVGGRVQDSPLFQQLMDSPDARKKFVANTKTWCATYDFKGVYLYWKYPPPSRRDDLTAMIRELVQELSPHNITLGVAVTEDPVLYAAYDVANLSDFVSNHSILMVPPTYTTANYTPIAFSYYRTSTIDTVYNFVDRFDPAQSQKVCVLIHAKAYTFRVVQPQIPVPDPYATRGPGDPGPITKREGQLSFGEVCPKMGFCNHTIATYSETLLCNDTWINYLTLYRLHILVCGMTYASDITCFGIWDSDFDDFTGSCGLGEFPLLKRVLYRVLDVCGHGVCLPPNLNPC